jgi:nuclease-like protein
MANDVRSKEETAMRSFIGLCALVVAMPVVAAEQPKPPDVDFRGLKAEPVFSVGTDGVIVLGTLDHQRRVRLLGVEPAGREGARFLESVLWGKSVYVVPEKDAPAVKDGDTVPAYLYRAPDGLFVNLELIARGHARTSAAPFAHRDLFANREQSAMQKGLGLWAPDTRDAEAPARAAAAPARRAPRRVAARGRPGNVNANRAQIHRQFNQAMNQLWARQRGLPAPNVARPLILGGNGPQFFGFMIGGQPGFAMPPVPAPAQGQFQGVFVPPIPNVP